MYKLDCKRVDDECFTLKWGRRFKLLMMLGGYIPGNCGRIYKTKKPSACVIAINFNYYQVLFVCIKLFSWVLVSSCNIQWSKVPYSTNFHYIREKKKKKNHSCQREILIKQSHPIKVGDRVASKKNQVFNQLLKLDFVVLHLRSNFVYKERVYVYVYNMIIEKSSEVIVQISLYTLKSSIVLGFIVAPQGKSRCTQSAIYIYLYDGRDEWQNVSHLLIEERKVLSWWC